MTASETQQLKKQTFDRKELDEKIRILSVYKVLIEYLNENKDEFKKLLKIARAIKRGLREDYDFIAAITGREGSGKSTLEIILAILIDKRFHLRNNLSLLPSTGEIKRMFKKIRRYGVLGIDEAIKILHKQDWYNVLQKVLVQMYATERYQNKCTLLAIPRFVDLNEQFRNHRVNCWFDVVQRGVAFVKVPIPVPYFQDPWLMKENAKRYSWLLKTKKGSQITIEDMQRVEKKNPCYVDTIRFPDLPKQIKEIYIELRREARLKEENEGVEELPKDKVRRALALQILRDKEKGAKNKEVAEKNQMSVSMVKLLAREGRIWLKKQKTKEKKERRDNW